MMMTRASETEQSELPQECHDAYDEALQLLLKHMTEEGLRLEKVWI